jgi:hypothetical protein
MLLVDSSLIPSTSPMSPELFCELLERLTGTPVKDVSPSDDLFLTDALVDGRLSVSQFNELLLLANKDRVEKAFFDFFFATKPDGTCAVSEFAAGVEKFQKYAMLCYGNFVYAFRTLSRISDLGELRSRFGSHARDTDEVLRGFEQRPRRVIDITSIERLDTHLVGYLAVRELTADAERALLMADLVADSDADGKTLAAALGKANVASEQRDIMIGTLRRLQVLHGKGGESVPEAVKSAAATLKTRIFNLKKVQATATRNTDVYLTWDHMDIYFATSMRKPWEFEDLHDFVSALTSHSRLSQLQLRAFDPTQSFDPNRIGKGLVEALMLKRAACTIYSVQDVDTLGKDSELAATLAQGKPVVAYAPTVDPSLRVPFLLAQRPPDLRDRLHFVLYADEASRDRAATTALHLLGDFGKLCHRYDNDFPWRSLQTVRADAYPQAGETVQDICAFIADGEKRIADARARTLRDSHPLALQVNLDTGVANGVLVARTIDECAELTARILTNSLELNVVDDSRVNAWLLKERLTGSTFRVVTKNRKLTNCFWNFYRTQSVTRAPRTSSWESI